MFVCTYSHAWVCAPTQVCQGTPVGVSEQLVGVGFFFHHVGPKDETEVISFSHKHLYQLSLLISPPQGHLL